MKNKNKKRLGVIAVALLLILAVGATAGTTLAKYISSVTTHTNTATVAKWGFTLNANMSKMFGDEYGDVSNTLAKVSGKNTVVVSAESGKNVVAPGTHGYMTFTVNGTAEVNAVLTFEFDGDHFENVVLTDGYGLKYYPINWYVGDTKVWHSESGVKSNAVDKYDFAIAIATQIKKSLPSSVEVIVTKDFKVEVFIPANVSIATLDLSISWNWAFEDANESSKKDTNIKDTLLGLISYKNNISYEELPENVRDWIFDYISENAAEADVVKNYTDAKGAVTTAENTLATTKSDLDEEIAKRDTALEAFINAQAAWNLIRDQYENPEVEAKENATYIAYKTAKGNYDSAVDAVKDAETDYNSAVADLASKKKTLADNENALITALGTYLKDYILKNSKTEISLGLAATVVQSQIATADEFKDGFASNEIIDIEIDD